MCLCPALKKQITVTIKETIQCNGEFLPSPMNTYLKTLLASLVLVTLLVGFSGAAHPAPPDISANQPSASSECCKSRHSEGKGNGSLELLTNVSAAIEAAGVSGGDYDARITRNLRFDALRIRAWTLHFSIREESFLDPSPKQLDHEFTYIAGGYQTPHGRIKLFWDHTCYNPSRKLTDEEKNGIHWNELGIGYETTGMMPGHKNEGITFDSDSEWLHSINWRASVSKIWMKTENDYEWIGKISIRDDVFRLVNHVFYVQLGLNSIYDDRGFTQSYFFEIGDRICFHQTVWLTPFLSYEHFHDWYGLGEGENFFFAGLRLEMGLGHEKPKNTSDQPIQNISWAPEFHITGGYATILDNEHYGHSSDFALDLDLIKLKHDKILSLNTYVGILTIPDDLNPYIIQYQVGPSLQLALDNSELRIFYSYSCLYGVDYTGVMRSYNLVGLELKNRCTSHWNWNATIGGYPSTKDFDYWGDLQGGVDYLFRKEGITPYMDCSVRYLQGDSSELGYALEAGVKIPYRRGSGRLYIRWQDDVDVFRYGKGTQTLLGIRFRF